MRVRALLLALSVVVAGVIVGVFFTRFLNPLPEPVTAAATSNTVDGMPVQNVTLTTLGAVGDVDPNDSHPNWVGYKPTTIIHARGNTVIHMTINQEDGASGLRNEYLGLVRGVFTTTADGSPLDGTVSVLKAGDGKCPQSGQVVGGRCTYQALDPNDSDFGPAHTFTIPDLGVSVPLMAVKNPDAEANVISFYFRVPAQPGIYRWQCFVPCAAGTLYGNGGPMETLGYMMGELVVS